jgi:hypothetical protein
LIGTPWFCGGSMCQQGSFPEVEYEAKKKLMRLDGFLAISTL